MQFQNKQFQTTHLFSSRRSLHHLEHRAVYGSTKQKRTRSRKSQIFAQPLQRHEACLRHIDAAEDGGGVLARSSKARSSQVGSDLIRWVLICFVSGFVGFRVTAEGPSSKAAVFRTWVCRLWLRNRIQPVTHANTYKQNRT